MAASLADDIFECILSMKTFQIEIHFYIYYIGANLQ